MVVNLSNIDMRDNPRMFILNPQKKRIGSVSGAYDVHFAPKYNEVSQLTFSVRAYTDGTATPCYDLLVGLNLIEIVDIGIFIILNPTTTGDGENEIKNVTANSKEYELTYRNIALANGTYAFFNSDPSVYSVVDMVHEYEPAWYFGDHALAKAYHRAVEVYEERVEKLKGLGDLTTTSLGRVRFDNVRFGNVDISNTILWDNAMLDAYISANEILLTELFDADHTDYDWQTQFKALRTGKRTRVAPILTSLNIYTTSNGTFTDQAHAMFSTTIWMLISPVVTIRDTVSDTTTESRSIVDSGMINIFLDLFKESLKERKFICNQSVNAAMGTTFESLLATDAVGSTYTTVSGEHTIEILFQNMIAGIANEYIQGSTASQMELYKKWLLWARLVDVEDTDESGYPLTVTAARNQAIAAGDAYGATFRISDRLKSMYRTFEANDNIYNFLMNTVQDSFNCLINYDVNTQTIIATDARSMRDYDTNDFAEVDPVYLSFRNLATEIELEEDTENIFTCLDVNGADGVNIRGVNPIGTNKIYDFDYFVENPDIFHLSDDFVAAYRAWAEKIRGYEATYTGLFTTQSTLTQKRNVLLSQIAECDTAIETTQIELDNAKETSALLQHRYTEEPALYGTDYITSTQKEQELAAKLTAIKRDKYQYESQEKFYLQKIEEAEKDIKTVVDDCSIKNNFAGDLYDDFSQMIKESTLQESSFVYPEATVYSEDELNVKPDVDYTVEIYGTNGNCVTQEEINTTNITSLTNVTVYALNGGRIRLVEYGPGNGANRPVISVAFDLPLIYASINYTPAPPASTTRASLVISAQVRSASLLNFDNVSSSLTISAQIKDAPTTETESDEALGTIVTKFVADMYSEGTEGLGMDAAILFSTPTNMAAKQQINSALYKFGKEAIKNIAQPAYSFSLSLGNFFSLEEYTDFANALSLGHASYIEIADGKTYKPVLVGAEFDYENPASLVLSFGDNFVKTDGMFKLADLLQKGVTLGAKLDAAKYSYGSFVSSGMPDIVSDVLHGDVNLNKTGLSSDDGSFTITPWGFEAKRTSLMGGAFPAGEYDPNKLRLVGNNLSIVGINSETGEEEAVTVIGRLLDDFDPATHRPYTSSYGINGSNVYFILNDNIIGEGAFESGTPQALTDALRAHKNNIGTLNTDVTNLDSRVGEVEGDITDLDSSVDDLQHDMSLVASQEYLADLEEAGKTLEEEVKADAANTYATIAKISQIISGGTDGYAASTIELDSRHVQTAWNDISNNVDFTVENVQGEGAVSSIAFKKNGGYVLTRIGTNGTAYYTSRSNAQGYKLAYISAEGTTYFDGSANEKVLSSITPAGVTYYESENGNILATITGSGTVYYKGDGATTASSTKRAVINKNGTLYYDESGNLISRITALGTSYYAGTAATVASSTKIADITPLGTFYYSNAGKLMSCVTIDGHYYFTGTTTGLNGAVKLSKYGPEGILYYGTDTGTSGKIIAGITGAGTVYYKGNSTEAGTSIKLSQITPSGITYYDGTSNSNVLATITGSGTVYYDGNGVTASHKRSEILPSGTIYYDGNGNVLSAITGTGTSYYKGTANTINNSYPLADFTGNGIVFYTGLIKQSDGNLMKTAQFDQNGFRAFYPWVTGLEEMAASVDTSGFTSYYPGNIPAVRVNTSGIGLYEQYSSTSVLRLSVGEDIRFYSWKETTPGTYGTYLHSKIDDYGTTYFDIDGTTKLIKIGESGVTFYKIDSSNNIPRTVFNADGMIFYNHLGNVLSRYGNTGITYFDGSAPNYSGNTNVAKKLMKIGDSSIEYYDGSPNEYVLSDITSNGTTFYNGTSNKYVLTRFDRNGTTFYDGTVAANNTGLANHRVAYLDAGQFVFLQTPQAYDRSSLSYKAPRVAITNGGIGIWAGRNIRYYTGGNVFDPTAIEESLPVKVTVDDEGLTVWATDRSDNTLYYAESLGKPFPSIKIGVPDERVGGGVIEFYKINTPNITGAGNYNIYGGVTNPVTKLATLSHGKFEFGEGFYEEGVGIHSLVPESWVGLFTGDTGLANINNHVAIKKDFIHLASKQVDIGTVFRNGSQDISERAQYINISSEHVMISGADTQIFGADTMLMNGGSVKISGTNGGVSFNQTITISGDRVMVNGNYVNRTRIFSYNSNDASYYIDLYPVYVDTPVSGYTAEIFLGRNVYCPGTIYASDIRWTNTAQSSDSRLKTNISEATSKALETLTAIDMKSFDWIKGGKHVSIGMIAQQLKEVAPDLVVGSDELAIDTGTLLHYCVKAIQELAEMVGYKPKKHKKWVDPYTLEEKLEYAKRAGTEPGAT